LIIGIFLAKINPSISGYLINPLINYGVPFSLVGLLLKSGFNINLLFSAIFSFSLISIFLVLFNNISTFRQILPTSTYQLGSLLGNSGYFGIPVAISLLPIETLNISIGYDIGAKIFCWSFGYYFISYKQSSSKQIPIKQFFLFLISSPAIRGLIGASIILMLPWSESIAYYLWIPSRVIIILALIIVGVRIGLLFEFNYNNHSFFNYHIFLTIAFKLIILPFFVLSLTRLWGLSSPTLNPLVLQAACPTAISLVLLSESNKLDENTAGLILMWSTLCSLITIPLWSLVLSAFN
tara:strand:+ start:524 stop:1405 length:882 start_codon:yes stop_codon:yes gene_type:complete